MIKQYVKGNLVRLMKQAVENNDEKVFFAHGCNCQAAMGSGIAPQIAAAFPQVEESDRLFSKSFFDDHKWLMLGEVFPASLTGNVTVFNLYTQFFPGRDLRLPMLGKAFSKLNDIIPGHKLLIPRIGAGVAGGDWEEISKMIDKNAPDVNIYVVDWDGTLE